MTASLNETTRAETAAELRQLRARFEAETLSVGSITRLLDTISSIADRLHPDTGIVRQGRRVDWCPRCASQQTIDEQHRCETCGTTVTPAQPSLVADGGRR